MFSVYCEIKNRQNGGDWTLAIISRASFFYSTHAVNIIVEGKRMANKATPIHRI